ncbi:MAG TPA: GNAT family N-acetyltransferase [Firmicutes bacterium]|nr:GNAT family N-acetyltransferase [Bacillota bacterium]
MENTPPLTTPRLLLRRFTPDDTPAMWELLQDEEVNTFLPWFPVKTLEEARQHLQERYLSQYSRAQSYHYAVCLRETGQLIGYANVSDTEARDLGYGFRKEFWHQGFATEAARAILEQLRRDGVPYITATHDVNNPHSGAVMRKLGMQYQYSYREQWQPKDILVTFRMYQLNLDGKDRVYRAYWKQYPHFVEEGFHEL